MNVNSFEQICYAGELKKRWKMEGVGSREEWGQESISLKEACLYANFKVC